MSSKLAIDQRLRRRVLPLMFLIVTLLMSALLAVRINGVRTANLEVATEGARNIFRIIVLTRQWNAEHGGVYVFTTDNSPPNPYLDDPQRDIELPDHRRLTLLNPAYMTRQIAELAAKDEQLHLRLHITSLKPIRPENRADPWETEALKQFDQGGAEIVEQVLQNGKNYLRYMAPLTVTPACLKCHAKQGYHLGDVRGGISVSLPFDPIEKSMRNEILATVASYSGFYVLLLAVSWGLIELLARRWRALDDTINTLQATRNELVETEKMASLGRLVAGFAHELNTPVGVAVGAITHSDEAINNLFALLSQDEVSEQAFKHQLDNLQEGHQLALANLRRAADLVQRFKRTSIDRSTHHSREYRLTELLQDVLMTLRNVLKHTAIEIDIDCPENLTLFGTPGLLEQVFTNLITNSVTHAFNNGRRAGHITIKAGISDNRRLLIDYRDDGVGMSDLVRDQAFEPFFTTHRESGGSGLGLYVTYNIINQQMHGNIHIVSAPDSGTCFHIDCPIGTVPAANEEKP